MTSTTVDRAALRLDSLTGIRAIAAFLVFWHHGNEYYDGWGSSGMVGVSLFYLLSGFVMAWTDRTSDTAAQFYRRRFARIYPAYFVAVTLAIALVFLAMTFEPTDFAAYTLLQAWVPSEAFTTAANAVFWSLSVEAFFYIVFPALRILTRKLRTTGLWVLGGAAATASFAIAGVGSFFPVDDASWAVIAFPPSRLPEFVIGAVLGTLVVRGWRPSIPAWFGFALSATAVVAALYAPYALSRYAVTLIPFAVLVVSLAVADINGRRLFTQAGWMVKLGVWSYCFYLLHLMVMSACQAVTNRVGLPEYVAVIIAVPASIVAAWLLHIAIERPFERWLRPNGRPRLDDDPATPTLAARVDLSGRGDAGGQV